MDYSVMEYMRYVQLKMFNNTERVDNYGSLFTFKPLILLVPIKTKLN